MSTHWSNMICAAASVALAVGLVAYADPALADTTGQTAPRIVLAVDAAQASTPAGHAAIERRIRFAANQVCGTGDAGQRIEESRCRERAVSEAKRQLADRIAMRSASAVQLAAR